jgi:DNA invertase Pin-like site-specific DNA recombinase
MLTVLGGLAEFERELIKARTSEGRKRAEARGVHMGRPLALNRDQGWEALARRGGGIDGYCADRSGLVIRRLVGCARACTAIKI